MGLSNNDPGVKADSHSSADQLHEIFEEHRTQLAEGLNHYIESSNTRHYMQACPWYFRAQSMRALCSFALGRGQLSPVSISPNDEFDYKDGSSHLKLSPMMSLDLHHFKFEKAIRFKKYIRLNFIASRVSPLPQKFVVYGIYPMDVKAYKAEKEVTMRSYLINMLNMLIAQGVRLEVNGELHDVSTYQPTFYHRDEFDRVKMSLNQSESTQCIGLSFPEKSIEADSFSLLVPSDQCDDDMIDRFNETLTTNVVPLSENRSGYAQSFSVSIDKIDYSLALEDSNDLIQSIIQIVDDGGLIVPRDYYYLSYSTEKGYQIRLTPSFLRDCVNDVLRCSLRWQAKVDIISAYKMSHGRRNLVRIKFSEYGEQFCKIKLLRHYDYFINSRRSLSKLSHVAGLIYHPLCKTSLCTLLSLCKHNHKNKLIDYIIDHVEKNDPFLSKDDSPAFIKHIVSQLVHFVRLIRPVPY